MVKTERSDYVTRTRKFDSTATNEVPKLEGSVDGSSRQSSSNTTGQAGRNKDILLPR